jgi:hypothetical protein
MKKITMKVSVSRVIAPILLRLAHQRGIPKKLERTLPRRLRKVAHCGKNGTRSNCNTNRNAITVSPVSHAPPLMVPSPPDKNLCRTVDVSADSPTRLVLPRIAARMGDESKAVGCASPTALLCEHFAFPPAKRSVLQLR